MVELENRSSRKGLFYVNATDDDYPFYKETFADMEIKIIRNYHAEIPDLHKERLIAAQSNR
jgi:hypothetical protein